MVRHKRSLTIETVEQAEMAYGGPRPMAKAFRLSVRSGGNGIAMWKTRGVPRGQQFGLYLGLTTMGYTPSPKLFGVVKWSEIAGATPISKGKRKQQPRRSA